MNTIRFWYDMATLDYRYIQTAPSYSDEHAVFANDGTVHMVKRSQAIDIAKFSFVIKEPQDMLDALIAAGFKPNKMEGTPGHVAALEKHIVFAERVVDKLLGAQ